MTEINQVLNTGAGGGTVPQSTSLSQDQIDALKAACAEFRVMMDKLPWSRSFRNGTPRSPSMLKPQTDTACAGGTMWPINGSMKLSRPAPVIVGGLTLIRSILIELSLEPVGRHDTGLVVRTETVYRIVVTPFDLPCSYIGGYIV
ncbi:hypothetical protein EAE_08985 [Klebsiella aerogenes KCTC 2190]|uniref:Uncharacterized protein n=1 Tax=Klebsiella aerogenes (strain ATCC 13048 / DSM 30053 / CCUG 1429 / JCM 1235 / KCTC 2190 / NBRC 13534 / NCIMB 10102 / NCTC 10006 / CDC 819-56) TaxID=1028307 RepID=A0A0H3FV89_KLEAK|nr:hypothetical protein EAE_08985 [Klebsiella aerogenes KCTC 2190]